MSRSLLLASLIVASAAALAAPTPKPGPAPAPAAAPAPFAAATPTPAPAPGSAPAATPAGNPIPQPPAVDARAYILIDHDSGRVLAEAHADDRMEPASLTKLMTSYAVFAALKEGRLKLTDMVHDQRARLAGRGLAHLRAGGHADPGRSPHQGHARAVRQRCDHRARREGRRDGGRVRADHERPTPSA